MVNKCCFTAVTDAQQRVNTSNNWVYVEKKTQHYYPTLFPQPFGQDFFQGRVLLVLSGVLVGVRLRCVGLVKLLEAHSLLLFAGVPLGLAELPLDALHLLPQVAVCLLQRAHLLGQSLDPLLLLEQSLLHRGAEQLPGEEQSTRQLPSLKTF